MTAPEPTPALRGARVEVDPRRIGQAVAGVVLLSLVGLIVALSVAGAASNARITALRQHGVPVEITVSRCLGLLGGSGSNAAGYTCTGAFSLDGRSYRVQIPGSVLRAPGSKVRGVASPARPGLVSTPAQLAGEHASWRPYLLPAILLLVLLALAGGWRWRRRSAGAASRPARAGGRSRRGVAPAGAGRP